MKFQCLLPEGFAWTQQNFMGLNQVGDKFSMGSIISYYQLLSWAFILSSTNILNTKNLNMSNLFKTVFLSDQLNFESKKKVFVQNMNLKPVQLHVLVFTLLCPSLCSPRELFGTWIPQVYFRDWTCQIYKNSFFFFFVVWKILLYVKVYCAFARTGQVVIFSKLPRLGNCFTVLL